MGISIDPNTLAFVVQNRSHYINSFTHIQFKILDKWLHDNSADLWSILTQNETIPPGQLILYGEWLVARHSIHYTRLPNVFIAFDIFDRKTETFYSTSRLREGVSQTSINLPPVLSEINENKLTREDFVRLVKTPSQFYDGVLEGIYVRKENDEVLLDRSKVVRADFICGNEHWSKGIMTWNSVDAKHL